MTKYMAPSLLLLFVVLLWSFTVDAADNALPRLFPKKAEVNSRAHRGLTLLELPEAVQREVKADLSDVRIIDSKGREVPYLVDSSALPWRSRSDKVVTRTAGIEELAREKRRADGRTTYHEELSVSRPLPHKHIRAWTLHLDSRLRRFVARVRVVDDSKPERVLLESSLYRLRDPLREGLALLLPRKLPERVRVIIDSEDGYLEPTGEFRGRQPHEMVLRGMPLNIISQSSDHGTTTLVLARSHGVQPLAIEISTATATFHRVISVLDSGPGGGDKELARGEIYRVTDLEGVASTRLPLQTPSGDKLTVRIEDGDSPALTEVKIVGLVEPPTLLFDADGPLTLLYGGGRAHRPRYDVAALPNRAALRDYDWTTAELEATTDNEAFDPSPALGFLLRAGAPLNTKDFVHRRGLTIKGAKEGLSKLRLSAEDVAASLNALADIRVVDKDQRQWPYLLERAKVTLSLDSIISEPMPRAAGTHYRVKLPASPLAVTALMLKTDARLVQRDYKLYGKRGKEQSLIASGRLSRKPGKQEPLLIETAEVEQDELDLVVSDGGDAPLVFAAASVNVSSADLFVAAPEGSYWMLLGNKDVSAPAYELAHARELALALPAPEIVAGAMEDNPDYEAKVEDPIPNRLMWGVLVGAVLILGTLTFRAARESPASSAKPDAEGS